MRRIIVLCTVLMVLAASVTASASLNAGPTWNYFAPGYGFATYPQSPQTTFRDAYSGGNFGADLAGILNAVTGTLAIGPPTIGGDDLLNSSLENWPSGSGM